MTKHLLSGHAHFRAEYFAGEADFLRKLATDQQRPSALYIGCSDSRVVPELLTSSRPGELFVVRNIANVIPAIEHVDSSVGAAVDYAVEKLGVPHIIVCGHDGCGGVAASIDGLDALSSLTSLHEWLSGVVPSVTAVKKLGLTGTELMRAAVEENVLHQMDNLVGYPAVARGLANKTLALHGWVFDLAEGALRVYDVQSQEFVPSDKLAR